MLWNTLRVNVFFFVEQELTEITIKIVASKWTILFDLRRAKIMLFVFSVMPVYTDRKLFIKIL